MASLAKVLEDIQYLTNHWPDLKALLVHGTVRDWRHGYAELTDAARIERDKQAWLDRHDTEGQTHGEAPAPLNLGILDLLTETLMTCDLLHERVAQTVGHPRLDHAASIGDDPRRFLAYIEVLLPEACETDPDVLDAAAEKVSRLRSRMMVETGEIRDGQALEAICPFCVGRTTKTPTGGAKTLRIRLVPARAAVSTTADETEPVIVCESGTCQPFDAEVSHWVKGAPAWPMPDWSWLSQRLIDPRDVGVA